MNGINYEDFIQNLLDEEENVDLKQFQVKQRYQELLTDYLRKLGKDLEEDYHDVLPFGFDLISEESKIKALEDALDKEITVEQSKYYLDEIHDIPMEDTAFKEI